MRINSSTENQAIEEADEANQIERGDLAMREELARTMGAEIETPKSEPEASVSDDHVADSHTHEDVSAEAGPSIEDRVNQLFDENQKLKRALSTTNGRYGSELQYLRSKIDSLNSQSAPDLKAIFEGLSIDDPEFEGIRNDFPEFSEKIINGIKNSLVRNAAAKRGQEASDQTKESDRQVQQEESNRNFEVNQDPTVSRLALERLQNNHPDMLDIAGYDARQIAHGVVNVKWKNQEFGEWIESMPDDIRESILLGGSAEQPTAEQIFKINDVLTEYKKTLKPAESTNTETKQPVNDQRRHKPDLNKALLPDGRQKGKSISITDEEKAEAAYQAELKKVMNGY